MLCHTTCVMLRNVIIEFVWAEQSKRRMTIDSFSGQRIYFSLICKVWWLNPVSHNVPPLSLSLHVHSHLFVFLSRGCPAKLVNTRMWCSTHSAIRNLVTTTSLMPFLPPSLLSIPGPHLHFTDRGFSSVSVINYLHWRSLAGDELTSAIIPVNPQALKQARRSFGLVLHCLASSSGLI